MVKKPSKPAVKEKAKEPAAATGKRQAERYRKLLLHQMSELMGKAEGTVDDLVTDNENFPDLTDRASAEADRNFGLRVRDRERKLIIKIKEALKRVEDGTFGTCEVCGEPIDPKRLEARPVTTLCIDCKIEQEREEKMRGE